MSGGKTENKFSVEKRAVGGKKGRIYVGKIDHIAKKIYGTENFCIYLRI